MDFFIFPFEKDDNNKRSRCTLFLRGNINDYWKDVGGARGRKRWSVMLDMDLPAFMFQYQCIQLKLC